MFLSYFESVNEGHPDKLFSQISDAVLANCMETPQARLLAKRRPRMTSSWLRVR